MAGALPSKVSPLGWCQYHQPEATPQAAMEEYAAFFGHKSVAVRPLEVSVKLDALEYNNIVMFPAKQFHLTA
jgi:hypothetical protein